MFIGSLYFTRGVQSLVDNKEIKNSDMWNCVDRHMKGDYGTLCQEDVEVNQMNLNWNSGTVMSTYNIDGNKIWVITNLGDAHTTYTTVLLPEEY